MKKAGDDKFRLNMKPEDLDPDAVPVDYSVPGESTGEMQAAPPPAPEPRRPMAPKVPAPAVPEPAPEDLEMEDLVEVPLDDDRSISRSGPMPAPAAAGLSAEQLEKIIRDQSADVIESVVWKVVPELAKQIIERELNKLLQERDSHPY
jgi:hypothetical protein